MIVRRSSIVYEQVGGCPKIAVESLFFRAAKQ